MIVFLEPFIVRHKSLAVKSALLGYRTHISPVVVHRSGGLRLLHSLRANSNLSLAFSRELQ
jgi:hypothetical protein